MKKKTRLLWNAFKTNAPAIIFIDEVDSLAANRIEVGTSGEREVQRTFMQLLAEIDGFKNLGDIKVIACTNRKDILHSKNILYQYLEKRFMKISKNQLDTQIMKTQTYKKHYIIMGWMIIKLDGNI